MSSFQISLARSMPFTLAKTSSLIASKIAFLALAFHFNWSGVGSPVNPTLVANHTSGAIASRYAAMRTFQ
ncbi:hypothetical protein GQ55_5G344400 [Panicum hallii var. hallii]|uniref:Uncharacterized protein n=1 Tax=Panicum hallii var. hallii TaxID=1504633 RepID=A0A2T7DM47_9POAL|nr:hypothetical protein GQ55_5G344400 [Panicum hallii var. hallii]